ncbi:MAG: xanthine dehydrogenase family protein molybdopterin-binding subunit [Dehalococcoidia bacterium]|nr:xanthine dehydrogenase family protein molybdopterin-binding subunit [Dehalococcoidia bacterium]MSQ34579.1 xanthine dehydrogenase family protein molybdopterin-binding subunit [Dehalococcoidia bacterium]
MVTTYKEKKSYRVIGTRPIRHDGLDKVTGKAVYGADVKLPGLIWGELLRSPYAHARIKKIDTSAAEKMPGVLAVVTHSDFPAASAKEIDIGEDVVNFKRASANIMASGKVLYKGHIVAAVAALDRNTALEACKLIKIVYEPLPVVLTVDEAIAQGAPILLDDLIGDDLGEKTKNTNVAKHFRHEFGDPEKGFEQSSLVVEREFTLQMVHQGYIEPQNGTALWDAEGRINVWSSTQGAFGVRAQTAGILRVDESKIKVNPVEIGGGFGGKTTTYLVPIAALLSKKSGRPVKIVMDRKGNFEGTGPAPGGKVKIKMGVNNQGKIMAATADIRFDAGAYPGSAVGAGAICVLAAYNIANMRIDGYDILVNKPKSVAYRAPGSPQVAFATEQVVDEICEKKGWDKLDFRLKNASREGTRRSDGPVYMRIGLEETLKAAQNSQHWKTPLERNGPNGKLRGRGVATGFWMNGGGKSSVNLMLSTSGAVMMNEGSADIGGTRASIAMQAAEVLGIEAHDVLPSIPDTDSIGFTGVTGGSRTTYATGLAAYQAAMDMIETLKARAAMVWKIDAKDVDFKDGTFYAKKDPELRLTFKQLAAKLEGTGGPVASTGSVDLSTAGGAFAVHIADIEIDPDTGKSDIIRFTAVQDVGKAVHPSYVEGQIQGAVAQGIGWALNEEYFMTKEGVMANSSFLDYRMPTALDMPMIEVVLVEVANPLHPFGVRGVGEVPLAPPLPAVANAIKDATGTRLFDLPMKPGRVLEALGKVKS